MTKISLSGHTGRRPLIGAPRYRELCFYPPRARLPGFTSAACDPAAFVEGLGTHRNIWIVGGNTVLAPLLDRDMVDHLIIQVAPVLLGEGIALFTQAEQVRRFKLEAVSQYDQFAELVYSR